MKNPDKLEYLQAVLRHGQRNVQRDRKFSTEFDFNIHLGIIDKNAQKNKKSLHYKKFKVESVTQSMTSLDVL